jgi:peroxiredoxin
MKEPSSEYAPDFTIYDHLGNPVSLSDFNQREHVVLIFNRGFI